MKNSLIFSFSLNLCAFVSLFSFTLYANENYHTDEDSNGELENYVSKEVEQTEESNNIFDVIFGKEEGKSVQKVKTSREETEKELPTVVVEESNNGSYLNIATIKVIDRSLGKLYLLDIPVSQEKNVNNLFIKIHKCWEPEEVSIMPNSRALVEISQANTDGRKQLFNEWIYAKHPSLSYLEHEKYDVSLKACKSMS